MPGMPGAPVPPLVPDRTAPPATVSVPGPSAETPTRAVPPVLVSRTRALAVAGPTSPASPDALGAVPVLAYRWLAAGAAAVPLRNRLLAYSVAGFSGTTCWDAGSHRTSPRTGARAAAPAVLAPASA